MKKEKRYSDNTYNDVTRDHFIQHLKYEYHDPEYNVRGDEYSDEEKAGAFGDHIRILIDPNAPGCWIKDDPKAVSGMVTALIVSTMICGFFEVILVVMMVTLGR